MKNYFLIIVIIILGQVHAQTGIGTTTPNASAKLDVYATNKGFLPPRVTLTSATDASTIASPAEGLLVYNTGSNPNLVAGYYYWNGSNWATIATATGSGVYASYMRGSRTSAQTTNLTINSLVAFNQSDYVAGQDISLNTSTGQITLAAGKTYRLLAQVPIVLGGTRPGFAWYNETSSSWLGSQSAFYNPGDAAGYSASGGLAEAIITASVTTTVSFRIINGNSLSNFGGAGDFSATGSYPWFDIQVISGNQAIESDRVSKFVNAGVPVSFGDIQVQMAPSGQMSLQIKTTGANITASCSAHATYDGCYTNAFTSFSDVAQTITSTFAYIGTSWGFRCSGDIAVYYVRDSTNNRFYRITLMVGPGYNSNMISIEKLI